MSNDKKAPLFIRVASFGVNPESADGSVPSATIRKDPKQVAFDWVTWGVGAAWLLTILGTIGGIVLAMQDPDRSGQHPYVLLGIGLAVFWATVGVMLIAVFNYLLWRVKQS